MLPLFFLLLDLLSGEFLHLPQRLNILLLLFQILPSILLDHTLVFLRQLLDAVRLLLLHVLDGLLYTAQLSVLSLLQLQDLTVHLVRVVRPLLV